MTGFPADETYSTEGPQCPHCGRQFTADEPGFFADDYDKEDCDECGKSFAVSVYTNTSWTCSPLDEDRS